MNEKTKSLAKRSQGYSNLGPQGKAWQESFKSELATAGAAIHPCIVIKPVSYILKQIFEFKKRAQAHLLPPIFNQPWISYFLMKSNDVKIKIARFKPRNMMSLFNFIYFKLNMIKF